MDKTDTTKKRKNSVIEILDEDEEVKAKPQKKQVIEKPIKVVVLTEASLSKQLEVNDYCHENGIGFIAADTRGLFGSVFNDFGSSFKCIDPTGEPAITGMIAEIEKVRFGFDLDDCL